MKFCSLIVVLVGVGACHDDPHYPIGGEGGSGTLPDAALDARMLDAKPDAPPPTRSCMNVQPVSLFEGNETLTFRFTCAASSDATGAVQLTLMWTDDQAVTHTRQTPYTLDCPSIGVPVNQFMPAFPADFVELVTHISGPLFDVDCT